MLSGITVRFKAPPPYHCKMNPTLPHLWLAGQSFTLTSGDFWDADAFISTCSHFCLFSSLVWVWVTWESSSVFCSFQQICYYFLFSLYHFILFTHGHLIYLVYSLQWFFQSFWYVIYTPYPSSKLPLDFNLFSSAFSVPSTRDQLWAVIMTNTE